MLSGKCLVTKIIKFSAVDGPGNRAVIFLQGCNFNCKFCHNPETISSANPEAELLTAEEVFLKLGTALDFIRGITVSGGEASLRIDFIKDLFTLARKRNLDTFVDTNGSVDLSKDEKFLKLTDYFMLDIKTFSPEDHILLCGVSNEKVLNNLKFLAENGKLFEIRTVISPNFPNCAETVDKASKIIASYGSIRYKLIKYRPNGVRKEFVRDFKVPSQDYMEEMKSIAEKNGVKDIVII